MESREALYFKSIITEAENMYKMRKAVTGEDTMNEAGFEYLGRFVVQLIRAYNTSC